MSHLDWRENTVDHRQEFYKSEREICSYQENRQREDNYSRYND